MHAIRMASALFAFAAVMTAGTMPAQTAPVSTTPAVFNFEKLTEQGKALLAKARAGSGSAGETVATFQGFYMTLNGRTKSGGGEHHKKWNDILIVLDGEGTELTGGTMVDPKDAPNGEIRGTRLDGATAHPMHKGDFIVIPAGTNHQQITEHGQTLVVLAVKIEASNPAATTAALTELLKQQAATMSASASSSSSKSAGN